MPSEPSVTISPLAGPSAPRAPLAQACQALWLATLSLMTAFLLLFILAGQTDINTVTPILVSMIGLGVGIDYSLFIVTRFRQLLHDGLEPRVAAAEAGASAGRAAHQSGHAHEFTSEEARAAGKKRHARAIAALPAGSSESRPS